MLISHASNVMLKIFQVRIMLTKNFQIYKLGLEKAEEPEIKLSTAVGITEKSKGISEKHVLLLH